MDSRPSVLIVDACEENREVLRTALEHRGMRTLATGKAKSGLELAREHHPDLIVLDLEVEATNDAELAAPFAEQSRTDRSPLVLLGTVRRRPPHPEGEFIAKPYHYGPLLRRIEELLDTV